MWVESGSPEQWHRNTSLYTADPRLALKKTTLRLDDHLESELDAERPNAQQLVK